MFLAQGHHLGTFWTCTFLGSTPNLLSQTLQAFQVVLTQLEFEHLGQGGGERGHGGSQGHHCHAPTVENLGGSCHLSVAPFPPHGDDDEMMVLVSQGWRESSWRSHAESTWKTGLCAVLSGYLCVVMKIVTSDLKLHDSSH